MVEDDEPIWLEENTNQEYPGIMARRKRWLQGCVPAIFGIEYRYVMICYIGHVQLDLSQPLLQSEFVINIDQPRLRAKLLNTQPLNHYITLSC